MKFKIDRVCGGWQVWTEFYGTYIGRAFTKCEAEELARTYKNKMEHTLAMQKQNYTYECK